MTPAWCHRDSADQEFTNSIWGIDSCKWIHTGTRHFRMQRGIWSASIPSCVFRPNWWTVPINSNVLSDQNSGRLLVAEILITPATGFPESKSFCSNQAPRLRTRFGPSRKFEHGNPVEAETEPRAKTVQTFIFDYEDNQVDQLLGCEP